MLAIRSRRAVLVVSSLALSFASGVEASALEGELRSRWLGAWVVLRAEVGSDCDDLFTNNKVIDGRSVHGAKHSLPPGELAKVVKLYVKRKRIDVFVELAEPWRASRVDGPFELFDQVSCRVELQVAAPRVVIKSGDSARAAELLGRILERHESREAAAASQLWNRRRVEPLPAGYQETLARYESWLEERLIVDLQTRLDRALDEAADIVERAQRSEDYALGLAAGLGRSRSSRPSGDCESLVDESFYALSADAPDELDERDWEAGYRDGQRLAFTIALADRLEGCLR